jgi:hypothetical protein
MRQSAVRGKGFHMIVRKIESWIASKILKAAANNPWTMATQSIGTPWDDYD